MTMFEHNFDWQTACALKIYSFLFMYIIYRLNSLHYRYKYVTSFSYRYNLPSNLTGQNNRNGMLLRHRIVSIFNVFCLQLHLIQVLALLLMCCLKLFLGYTPLFYEMNARKSTVLSFWKTSPDFLWSTTHFSDWILLESPFECLR